MAKVKAKATENENAEGGKEAKGTRKIMLAVDGKEVSRVDYIRDLWKSRNFTRGEIAKKLSELQGKTVPYQIVFAATKDLEGGKPVEKKSKAKADSDSAEA